MRLFPPFAYSCATLACARIPLFTSHPSSPRTRSPPWLKECMRALFARLHLYTSCPSGTFFGFSLLPKLLIGKKRATWLNYSRGALHLSRVIYRLDTLEKARVQFLLLFFRLGPITPLSFSSFFFVDALVYIHVRVRTLSSREFARAKGARLRWFLFFFRESESSRWSNCLVRKGRCLSPVGLLRSGIVVVNCVEEPLCLGFVAF